MSHEDFIAVEAGALTAPFAFLGPAWDGELTAAYAGGKASMKRLFTLDRDTVIKGIAWRKLG